MGPKAKKDTPVKAGAASKTAAEPVSLGARIPGYLRFPLLVFTNLAVSSALFSLAADYTAGDLGIVSRSFNQWWEVIGLIAWRTAELGIGWVNHYDGIDLACLTLLSHLPPLYLLTEFYGVRSGTILASVAIDIFSIFLPFRLLRPLTAVHDKDSSAKAVSNRTVLSDPTIIAYTTVLSGAVYSIVVYASFKSWIPIYLLEHFEGIRDLSFAHAPAIPSLALTFLPVGYAAKEFIFVPALGSQADLGDAVRSAFNPETATLYETFLHNVWGQSKRTKTIIRRTALLAAVSSLNTWMQVFVTVEGATASGAAGWASMWVIAEVATAAMLWWICDV